MQEFLIQKVTKYVEENIHSFHDNRISGLNKLKLNKILKKKNPYILKAKNMLSADDIVHSLLTAHLSSSEETMFGDWLEGLAIFIAKEVYGGWKSSSQGIDLEFEKENIRYIVSIKSSPNWGNSSQVKKLKEDFNATKKILQTSNSKLNIIAVNGCCTGIDSKSDKGEYFKYCGQEFWNLISGCENLYIDIIEPLAKNAKERNEEFLQLYAQIKNRFVKEFIENFCMEDYSIDWEKLVKLNSKKI